MKKVVSALVSLTIFASPMTVFADDLDKDEKSPNTKKINGENLDSNINLNERLQEDLVGNVANSENKTNKSLTNEESSKEEELVEHNKKSLDYVLTGNLEVDVNFALPIKNTSKEKTNISLKLSDSNGNESMVSFGGEKAIEELSFNINGKDVSAKVSKLNSQRGFVTLDNPDVSYYNVVFNNIPIGIYNIELIGKGFNTIEVNNIDISDYSKRVLISNDSTFLFGDFNHDNKVDDIDYEALFQYIDTDNYEDIIKYDLNRDNLVDITDLMYVYKNIDAQKKEAEVITTNAIIDPDKITFAEDSNQVVEGNLGDIFLDERNIKIGLKQGNISEENPAKINMIFDEPIKMEQININSLSDENAPKKGKVLVKTESGEVLEFKYNSQNNQQRRDTSSYASENKNIVIELGKQVAVKEVSIIITGTTTNANLAEISKVEFLNNVYTEIPKPEMNIPKISNIETDSEEITLEWNHETNVTGYEVKLNGLIKGENKELIIQTTENKAIFKEVDNYTDYEIVIQSLNGEWQSGYSDPIVVQAKPKSKPEAPEGINIEGLYKGLKVSWKKNKKATEYDLYYRKTDSSDDFKVVKGIKELSYTLTDLENETEYEIYLIASNEHGTSGNSSIYRGKTLSINPPITPNYKLINTSNGVNNITSGIKKVEFPYKDNNFDDSFDDDCVVDDDYSSSWTIGDWDSGLYSKRGPIITFDKEYTIDTIALIPRQEVGYQLPYKCNIGIWDEENNKWNYVEAEISHKNNNGSYAILKLQSPITTKKLQVNPSVYGGNKLSISELKFYNYDSLENDIRNLFTDDLLIEIKEDVTQEKINELRERANTIDSASGEYHPSRAILLDELQLAEDILNDKNISKNIMTINQNINNSGTNLGMLNDWQSLGVAARAGEEIVVYVGTKGDVVPELVVTQYYGESGKFYKTIKLNKGRNVIEIPKLDNLDVEKGGSIYVRYPNASPSNNEIKVRVSRGEQIPHLNVYELIGDSSKEAEVKDEIRTYIRDLKKYVENLPNKYSKIKITRTNKYPYNKVTSVLNTTDIETDKITLNLPATAVLEGITSGISDEDAQVERVYESLLAWEQIMDLAYAERGVSSNPDFDNNGKIDNDEKKNLTPRSRMNIKYQRMFTGAFMYASSLHVGVEYNSVPALMQGKPYKIDEDGNVIESGALFGWGIAHEIGHVTDIGKMTYGETTNNVLSLLSQTFDDRAKSRLETSGIYDKVYEKVTSGTMSLPSNVFVKLGMFWQLHLAYDNNPTSMMLVTDTDKDLNNDSFYAKLSRRYRNLTAEENKLDKDDLLVRIASEVVQKDLSEFFWKWGIRPSKETLEYVSQYPKEDKAIYYLNDEARRQRLSGVASMNEETVSNSSFAEYKDGQYVKNSKSVKLNLGVNQDSDKILGYEIYRNGVPVAFTSDNFYTDIIDAANNMMFTYDVVAYDYNLNKTEKQKLGSIKISHDGSISKNEWTVDTNTKADEDKNNSEDTSGPIMNPSINNIMDNDANTSYLGEKEGKEDPYVIIETNKIQPLVGVKYTAPISDNKLQEGTINNYEIYVSNDKVNWTLTNSGKFNVTEENPTEIIYFNKEDSTGGKQLWTHESSYVKIVAPKAKEIAIGEIDLIAPPGDNIEIGNEGANGIGKLDSDFEYAPGKTIPQGSIIITGEYRGNPAFNVALLKDEDNNVIPGKQILMAEIPENANLGEISSGTWIYWLEPSDLDRLSSKVKAELFRVNNAETNEGQRLVSDTLYVDVPSELPSITLNGGSIKANKNVSYYDSEEALKLVE